MDFDSILTQAHELGASDLHIKPGRVPTVRVGTRLSPLDGAASMSSDDVRQVVDGLLDESHQRKLRERFQVDCAYGHERFGRYRVNVFMQQGLPAIAMRVISPKVSTIAELNLPTAIEKIAEANRGLVLCTGTTGSGKSTTLASMIRHINETRARHIITIEDPVEYLHSEVRSLISQREIGEDALSFAESLRGALRQDPDVILVGEMRDLETIETAILAAETGHLVLSTLHTLDARETITRVISVFPEHQRDQVRLILSSVLQGIISQRLIPHADGKGMVPAVEVMVSTARIRECIAVKEKTVEIRDAIAQGYTTYGMQTFDQSLLALLRQELITYDEALAHSSNPSDFALKVSGVASTSDTRWDDFEKGEEPEEAEDSGLKIDRF